MSIACRFTGHEASDETVANGGRLFSRCLRCGRDLIELGGAWKSAPKGFRIVWRSAEAPIPSLASQVAIRSMVDRRQSIERRLPAFLNGNDRRLGERRRKVFGRKVEAAGRQD